MSKSMSRRNFLAGAAAVGLGAAATAGLAGCGNGSGKAASSEVKAPEKLVFAWEPGASEGKYENMRDIMAEAISDGAGVPCDTMTTTDYNVCIEAVNSGQAHYASLGAKEYVELHKKNPKVEVAWVLSDSDGNLNPVSYHSQILVLDENADNYKDGDTYKLTTDNTKGKNMSWVELSSTSGYVIPSIAMAKEFGVEKSDDLGEAGKYFTSVEFGGSHVKSIYGVLTKDSDLCACDDTGAANNYNVIEGKNGEIGALYEIKQGLEAPLDKFGGMRLRVVQSLPVPAVPFVVNTAFVPEDMNKKVVEYMSSEKVYGNKELFKDPSDKTTVTKYTQKKGNTKFIQAPDSYYDDFRKMLGE